MTNLQSQAMFAPLFSSAAMRAVVNDRARLQRMLDFEAALARAEAALGVIAAGAANEIAGCCRAELYDITVIGEAAVETGNVAIPLVNALTAEVTKRNPDSAGYVHWGATSQDVIDTALALELRDAIDVLLNDLERAIKAFTTLAGRHRRTMTVARTLLQHALPMPFGLKLVGYAAALARSRDRLRRLRKEALALQFGGAAGTLAALDDNGLDVSERLAALLDLALPDAPWHGHRDRLAEVASAFAILAGTCGKIARDVTLLMQTEVGEVSEPEAPGRGASSTLPHKRNPTAAAAALSAATIAPNLCATILAAQIQEHERAVGGSQAEWSSFPALALVVSDALHAIVGIAEGLEVDVERMRTNLEHSGGQIMAEAVVFALAPSLGKQEAQQLVKELSELASKQKRPFKDVLEADARMTAKLNATEIERMFMPTSYQGSSQSFIDRLVASAQGRTLRRPERRAESQPPAGRRTEAKIPPAAQMKLPPVAMLETKPAPVEEPVPAPIPTPASPAPSAPARDDATPSPLMEVFMKAEAPTTPKPETAPQDEHKPA